MKSKAFLFNVAAIVIALNALVSLYHRKIPEAVVQLAVAAVFYWVGYRRSHQV